MILRRHLIKTCETMPFLRSKPVKLRRMVLSNFVRKHHEQGQNNRTPMKKDLFPNDLPAGEKANGDSVQD